jgi:hypothetical protein
MIERFRRPAASGKSQRYKVAQISKSEQYYKGHYSSSREDDIGSRSNIIAGQETPMLAAVIMQQYAQ